MRTFRGPHQALGFSYIGLLLFVAVLGVVSISTLQTGAAIQRRWAEDELLFIGNEFRLALISYAKATPKGQPSAPHDLSDLLQDPRYPSVIRHLRKIYVDPMTGEAQWGVMPSVKGSGIGGVYSLSQRQPLKVAGFDSVFSTFEKAATYSDWKFSAEIADPLP